jgi:hypothetical protein
MFRKLVLVVMLMAFSSVCSADLRTEGAQAYLLGFLGGNGGIYASSPAVHDDVLFTLRRMAYPLSTWAWAQAVIENSSVKGDVVTLTVSKPDVSGLLSGRLPESIEEWKGYLSLGNTKVPVKQEEIKLRVNALGEVDMSKKTLEHMLQAVEEDMVEALEWCLKNPESAPKAYVLSLRAEVRHGIVPLPEKIKKKIEETAKLLEGGKR